MALGNLALSSTPERDHGSKMQVVATSLRYGIALACVAAALGSSLLLQRLFPYPFLFLFFAAVMASAALGLIGAIAYATAPPLPS